MPKNATLIMRGARVRYVDVRREDEAGVFTRLHMAADLSDPVREFMEWEQIPDCVASCKLTGAITARSLSLTPAEKPLQQHAFEIECSDVSDFAVAALKDDNGEVCNHELRFIARSIQEGAAALLEGYMRTVGGGVGQLRVAYVKQEKLDLQQPKDAQTDDGQDVIEPGKPQLHYTGNTADEYLDIYAGEDGSWTVEGCLGDVEDFAMECNRHEKTQAAALKVALKEVHRELGLHIKDAPSDSAELASYQAAYVWCSEQLAKVV